MNDTRTQTPEITELILKTWRAASASSGGQAAVSPSSVAWPVACTVDLGLEGAPACQTSVGNVDGRAGRLSYRGYDIFELAAHSTYEEVAFLLLHGHLPSQEQLVGFQKRLAPLRKLPRPIRRLRRLLSPDLSSMAALRLGTSLMREECTQGFPASPDDLAEHKTIAVQQAHELIAGMPTIAAAICRMRHGGRPLEPDESLSHAANFLYMMTGERPTPQQERLMDVALILHADHGMSASTFAAMVVASTMADLFFAVGAGLGALSGPLHGDANERVLHMLRELGHPSNVLNWYRQARDAKRTVPGFGHRVYRTHDPRARILQALIDAVANRDGEVRCLLEVARSLEAEVLLTLDAEKRIFPSIDLYSGLLYEHLGIPVEMFTPIFAVSRVAGWAARILEYLSTNRVFYPQAIYTGPVEVAYVPLDKRNPPPVS